jgi:hypothetical protein
MWEKVAKRSHKPIQIYPFGAGSDDVMLHGTVDYVLKDDKKTSTSWGAKAHFTKEDGELKMDFYQVFLVSKYVHVTTFHRKRTLTRDRILALWREPNSSCMADFSNARAKLDLSMANCRLETCVGARKGVR